MKLSLLMLASLVFVGCNGPMEQAQSLPTITMQIGNKKFTLEVADTDESRRIGLMFRNSMPADHGMIFLFDHADVQGFWMKNTNIPLDIIYLSADQKIVSIHQMEPHDLQSVSSDYPAQYAIELNQGAAQICGAKVGDQLSIPRAPASQPASQPASKSSR